LQKKFAYIHALVSQIDAALGSIMEHVDPRNTLVIFSADHGDYMGHRGRIEKHPWMPFEPVARVPFVAYGAGVPEGVRIRRPVGLVDLAPTFLSAAGVEAPGDLDGEPLQRYLHEPDFGRDRVHYCYGVSELDMVRRDRYKYFRSRVGKAEILIDLAEDPGELRNRAADPTLRDVKLALTSEMDAIWEQPVV
jgi:choline-sulfatase